MNADLDASWPEAVPPVPAARSSIVAGAIRRIPRRLRERRFWEVQALVLLITALHGVLESTEALGEHEALSFVPVSFYFIPIVYAGLNFGMEGALPTALWSAALAQPNVFVWHAGLQRFGEILQLAIMIGIAIVVARRVDEETTQRRRAEKTSASLRLLNEIGELLSHTLDVERQVPQVLRRLMSGLSLQSAWLCLEPEPGGGGPITMAEVSSPGAQPPMELANDLHRLVATATGPIRHGGVVAVPLIGEASRLGSLGAAPKIDETLNREQVELLTTVAHEMRVALENARLYRQRQDSLRSYARQVTQAQEDERLRIARELHDETAQELVQVVRKLELLRGAAEPGLAPPIDELLNVTRSIVQAVRRYSRDLRPSVLDDLGLLAALEMAADDANSLLGGGARLTVSGKPYRLDPTVELALFRIAQEALRNVEKHAEARSATIKLDFNDSRVRLSVSYDGRGFSPPQDVSYLAHAGKLGLVGMKERAELVGGRFELRSAPGKGTQVVVAVTAGAAAQA